MSKNIKNAIKKLGGSISVKIVGPEFTQVGVISWLLFMSCKYLFTPKSPSRVFLYKKIHNSKTVDFKFCLEENSATLKKSSFLRISKHCALLPPHVVMLLVGKSERAERA